MGKAVFVVGTGRSGTSMLAGMLHKLGVYMGDEFAKAEQTWLHKDFFGTYEEREIFDFHRSMKPWDDLGEWIDGYIAKRSEGHDLWGVKDPVLVRSFPYFTERVDGDVKVIVARRNKIPTISSYVYAYHSKLGDAQDWYKRETGYLKESLEKYDGTILYVDYDDLFENPRRELSRVIEYVFDGESVDQGLVEYAISHVNVKGRRFDRDGKWLGGISKPVDGWGNVAIGVRVAKYPEYHFFNSWTKLLTGGVRGGDTVLMPAGWMPAHWASNALARDFLRTNKDSLLMIDDDMVFEQDDLERLRTNIKNYDYDVISGFCTHRRWPPKPIVMREMEVQPEEPYSLYGRSYEYVHDEIKDGDIVDVDATGLAFTLIKRYVLESMTEEYGPMFTSYFSYGKGVESDDIPFAQKVKELGFKIGIDTSVKIGHIGQAVFGWGDYKQWMREHNSPNVVEFNAGDLVPILEEAIPLLGKNKNAAQNVLKWIGGE